MRTETKLYSLIHTLFSVASKLTKSFEAGLVAPESGSTHSITLFTLDRDRIVGMETRLLTRPFEVQNPVGERDFRVSTHGHIAPGRTRTSLH